MFLVPFCCRPFVCGPWGACCLILYLAIALFFPFWKWMFRRRGCCRQQGGKLLFLTDSRGCWKITFFFTPSGKENWVMRHVSNRVWPLSKTFARPQCLAWFLDKHALFSDRLYARNLNIKNKMFFKTGIPADNSELSSSSITSATKSVYESRFFFVCVYVCGSEKNYKEEREHLLFFRCRPPLPCLGFARTGRHV